MKKVTVIIPVYNVAEYIYRCLHSIAEQTYPLIEIIVVDDQSRDNSVAEMERAQQELFKFNSLGGVKRS